MGFYPWDVSRPAHKRMIKFNFFQGAEALSFECGGSHQEKPRRHSRPVLYALSASPRQPGGCDGVSIEVLSKLLGHSSVITTSAIYGNPRELRLAGELCPV